MKVAYDCSHCEITTKLARQVTPQRHMFAVSVEYFREIQYNAGNLVETRYLH
jgi:hypothetical protein